MEYCFYTISTDEKSQIIDLQNIDSVSLKRTRNEEKSFERQENKNYKQILKYKCKERKKKIHGIQQTNFVIPSKKKLKELSNVERAQIQKLKNRQSAQRARDNKKQYILNLEKKVNVLTNQVNQLKNQLLNQKQHNLCSRCRQQIVFQKQNIEKLFPIDEYLERISLNSDRNYGILTFTILCIFLFFNMSIGQKNTSLAYVPNQRLLMNVQQEIQNKNLNQFLKKDYNVPATKNVLTKDDKCIIKFFDQIHQPISFYENNQKKKNLRLNSNYKYKNDIIHCGNPKIFKFYQNSNFYQQQSSLLCSFSKKSIFNLLKQFKQLQMDKN